MKFAMIALFLTFNASVWAQTTFTIKPNELQIRCSKNAAYLSIDKLGLYTKSNHRVVETYVQNEVMCLALTEYYRNQASLKVEVGTPRLDSEQTLVRELPCEGYSCYSIYRYYTAEYVSVLVNGVQFSGKGIVPGSERTKTIEWDSRSCPPSHPDCDL